MSRTNLDNIYAVGTLITAKENPTLQLKIMNYYQGVYYCAILQGEGRKQLAYFEHELICPVKPGEQPIPAPKNKRSAF